MKILCNNVRVWTRDRDKTSQWFWKKRMTALRSFIESEAPDILCLQELSFPANLIAIPKGYRRVGLTASHPIYVKKGTKTRAHRFRIRFDKVEIKAVGCDEWISLINVHLHWNKVILARNMMRIERLANRGFAKGCETVICGDFNNAYWKVESQISFVAFWKSPIYDAYTFQNKESGSLGCLDYFLLTRGVHENATAREFDAEYNGQVLSDHSPVMLTVL